MIVDVGGQDINTSVCTTAGSKVFQLNTHAPRGNGYSWIDRRRLGLTVEQYADLALLGPGDAGIGYAVRYRCSPSIAELSAAGRRAEEILAGSAAVPAQERFPRRSQ